MLLSKSYAEMVSQASGRVGTYPAPCLELFRLDQAQHRAKRNEADLFQQFALTFDWDLPRPTRNQYLKKLSEGSTLILTDLTKTILWTSQRFLAMTGFTPAESMGRKPSMLQGPGTDPSTVLRIRNLLRDAHSVEADLLNYRKNGEAYRCHVAIDPLYTNQGKLSHFLAVEDELV